MKTSICHRTQSSPSVQSIDWMIQRPFGATSFSSKKIRRLLRISHPFHHPRHPPFFHRDTSFSSPKKKRMAHLPLPIRPANSCTLPLPQSKVSTARSVTSGSVSPSSVSRISNEAWFLERRCSFHPGGSGFFSGRYLGEI